MPGSSDTTRQIYEHLEDLPSKKTESLKGLFWETLGYDRVMDDLPSRDWIDSAKANLDQVKVFADHSTDFRVIWARLKKDNLLKTDQRPIINAINQRYPYNLILFSDRNDSIWDFVNVKLVSDDPEENKEPAKRRIVRRISIREYEPVRTAAERLTEIAIDSEKRLPPLYLQEKHDRAFDVEKVTREFFDEYLSVFKFIESNIVGFEKGEAEHKRLFTQLLFNRLLFIRFLEKKGWLYFNGTNKNYLKQLYKAGGIGKSSFFKSRLVPLFFKGLAIPGEQENEAIGKVPYLNGGLFDKKPYELKVKDIKDEVFRPIIGENSLFYRFNFTVEESTPLDIQVAIDPEMLGKVFEKLVTTRKEHGSYYTPRHIVSFMCRETLKGYLGGSEKLIDEKDATGISIHEARVLRKKLAEIKVVDPACGSGAYLLGMLHELHAINRALETRIEKVSAKDDYRFRLSIIQNNLYGVDFDEFATNIACLRLWLSLAVEFEGDIPEPLPNLDFKIGCGDSLTAQDPQIVQLGLFQQKEISEYSNLKVRYTAESDTAKKTEYKEKIEAIRRKIAKWVHPKTKAVGFDWAVEFAEVFIDKQNDATIDGELDIGEKLSALPKRGGFDIIIANPPYGGVVSEGVRGLYFNRKTEGAQSKDTYGLFMTRAIQLLRPGGQFSFIISDTWRTIGSHRPLRKLLLDRTSVSHVLDLPPWVFDATVNTCILTLEKKNPLDDHQITTGDLRSIPKGEWDLLAKNLQAVSEHGLDIQTITYARYTYPQKLISTYTNLSFFIGSPKLYRLMSDRRFTKLGDQSVAEVKVGLQTGDNQYYLRKMPSARGSYKLIDESKVLTEKQIAKLSKDEKENGIDPAKYNGRHFVSYDKGGASDAKGGWLPNYFVPTEYFIDWSKSTVKKLKKAATPNSDASKRAYVRNSQYYFQSGLTFSRTGFYAPTFRLGSGSVFDTEGSLIYSKLFDIKVLLSLLTSRLSRYILKNFIDHTVHAQVEDIKELPLSHPSEHNTQKIIELVDNIIDNQTKDRFYSYYQYEQNTIDQLICDTYELDKNDLQEIELWFCRRYPKLATAQGVIAEVQSKYADHLKRCELILSKPSTYWKAHPILELISSGESSRLEFKETLEADNKTGRKFPGLIHSTLKTVCAFANSDGGTLLIGVSDAGEIMGIEKDYALCGKKQDRDGFELKLRSLLRDRFDPPPLDIIETSFIEIPEGTICRIEVKSSKEIIHLDNKEVWVRDGNRSIRLEGRTLTDWIQRKKAT